MHISQVPGTPPHEPSSTLAKTSYSQSPTVIQPGTDCSVQPPPLLKVPNVAVGVPSEHAVTQVVPLISHSWGCV